MYVFVCYATIVILTLVNSADVQKKAQPNDKINDKSNSQSAPKKTEERKPSK